MDPALLKKVSMFSGLSDDALRAIAEVAIPKHYAKGKLILLAEEEGDTLFVIGKGTVKVSITSEDGREVILSILREGDFFGEMSLLDGKPRSATVTALEDTEAFLIRRPEFLKLLEKVPQISIRLLEELTGRLRKADKKIESLALMDVTGRIISTLLQLADESGVEVEDGILVRNRPTHQQLAEMAGTTRETVSRVLKKLERLGYICSGSSRDITILKLDEMKRELII